mmetsp:Transcript_1366/g.3342  ORF Transcript_1366/g.3342 Transcript_1366/m.3342 type:complete len:275 (-) Transcript_1366:295-1119(-)
MGQTLWHRGAGPITYPRSTTPTPSRAPGQTPVKFPRCRSALQSLTSEGSSMTSDRWCATSVQSNPVDWSTNSGATPLPSSAHAIGRCGTGLPASPTLSASSTATSPPAHAHWSTTSPSATATGPSSATSARAGPRATLPTACSRWGGARVSSRRPRCRRARPTTSTGASCPTLRGCAWSRWTRAPAGARTPSTTGTLSRRCRACSSIRPTPTATTSGSLATWSSGTGSRPLPLSATAAAGGGCCRSTWAATGHWPTPRRPRPEKRRTREQTRKS